ncbi:nucleoside 2-deoxyribosyltransferase [Terasakiella sp.]|uniref:nucleoside 2-deoxyribosyltransferase n=2 Tax=Terasakiella TaxID=196080 RepID=UPI003B00E055
MFDVWIEDCQTASNSLILKDKEMTIRIYLAGPGVFYPDPVAHSQELKEICAQCGLEGVFPMDAGLDISNLSKHRAAHAIYEANIELIDSCCGVMADMQAFRGPGMDGGTAFEMGYAVAKGLPVVGYNARSTYLERTRGFYNGLQKQGRDEADPLGLIVEDFDLVDNLMMACGAQAIVCDAQNAADLLSRLCAAD